MTKVYVATVTRHRPDEGGLPDEVVSEAAFTTQEKAEAYLVSCGLVLHPKYFVWQDMADGDIDARIAELVVG